LHVDNFKHLMGTSYAISHTGKYIAITTETTLLKEGEYGHDKDIYLYNSETDTLKFIEVPMLHHDRTGYYPAFSNDETHLAFNSGIDAQYFVYSIAEDKVVEIDLEDFWVRHIYLDETGEHLAYIVDYETARKVNDKLKIIHIATNTVARTIDLGTTFSSSSGGVSTYRITSDFKYAVFQYIDIPSGGPTLWSLRRVNIENGETETIRTQSFASDVTLSSKYSYRPDIDDNNADVTYVYWGLGELYRYDSSTETSSKLIDN